MTIFGLDYQQFWTLAGAVWFVLQVTGLIILAAGVGAVNGFLERIERIITFVYERHYPDENALDERMR